SLLGKILARKRLAFGAKHAQRRAAGLVRRKKIYRHTYQTERQRSRPERSRRSLALFDFLGAASFASSFRQRASPSSTSANSFRARYRATRSCVLFSLRAIAALCPSLSSR